MYLAGFSMQMITAYDVSVLSVYPLIAEWDLGMTTADYDGTICSSCYSCSVGSSAHHRSAMSGQPV